MRKRTATPVIDKAIKHLPLRLPLDLNMRLKEIARKMNALYSDVGKVTIERLGIIAVREYIERNEK